MTLTFPPNYGNVPLFRKACLAIVLLLFKRAIAAPNKLIDIQHYNRHTGKRSEKYDRIPFMLTFHPHNHAVKTIILKNLK